MAVFKAFASQPMVVCSSPKWGHDHDSSYDASTGWFQEADFLRVIYLSCENLFHECISIYIVHVYLYLFT